MDKTHLKKTFAKFPTGVTIVTNFHAGEKIAVTISSFSSLSLEPALLSFNLAATAKSFKAFAESDYFVVNILSNKQEDEAMLCAKSGADKLAQIEHSLNEHNIPILTNSHAIFQCRKYDMLKLGDHYIVAGEVEACSFNEELKPLYYYNSKFYQF